MKLRASCVVAASSFVLAQAAKAPARSPVLVWSSNSQLFNNDEVSKRLPMHQVFEMIVETLESQPDATPYLIIHMLPRGIQTQTVLKSEAEEVIPPKILADTSFGSHMFFPNVTKAKDFNLTESWADLYQRIHISQHQQDKKRIAILTNRDVQEDEEAFKVVLPESAFVFDEVAERMGDTRILLIEGGALLQSNGNDASHWTIMSALLGKTTHDVLLISADIDPPVPKKQGRRIGASPRKLQGVISGRESRADTDVVLRVKPGQLAIFLFIGAFTFTVLSAVLCTMQVNTPVLYLEKTVPINKEF